MTPAMILIAAILATLRVLGHHDETFQAVAHLFTGGMIGAGAVHLWEWVNTFDELHLSGAKVCLGLAVVISLIELACFILLPK